MSKNFSANWVACSLGDVLTFINGRAYKQHEMLRAGTPLLRIQNLNGGANWYFSDLNLPADKYCHKGDLLYAWSATFGPYLWQGPTAIFHYHIWNVLPSQTIHKQFAFYQLTRITDDIKRAAHGVAMPHITKAGMEAWSISLPPLSEQKRIADKLDTLLARVDACRERLDQVPMLLTRFRQSVLAAATSGKLTDDWRKDTDSQVAQTSDGLPSGWSATTIGALAEDLRYGTSKKCDYATDGTPVLRIPNIGDHGQVTVSDLKYAEFESNEIEKLALRKGDLLVIRSNGSVDLVGKIGLVTEQQAGMLFAGYLIRLRIDPKLATPEFVHLCLTSPLQRQRIEVTSRSTSGVNNINSEELRALPVLLAPVDEQLEINRRVDRLFGFAKRLEERVTKAQASTDRLTPALLAKAFRGELVPQDSNDEPAAELLKRLAGQKSESNAGMKRKGSKGARQFTPSDAENSFIE